MTATIKLNNAKTLIFLLVAVILLGLALIISRQFFSYSGLVFDVLTYSLSILALVLAVLSVVNSIRQNRAMNRMVHDVHAAIAELKEITVSNEKIERELSDEYRMNKVITDVLSEYGVGNNERMRTSIAHRVSRRLKK